MSRLVPRRATGIFNLILRLRNWSKPMPAKIAKPKVIGAIKREGWAVEIKGNFKIKGNLAKGVGRVNNNMPKMAKPSRRPALDQTAETARMRGMRPR